MRPRKDIENLIKEFDIDVNLKKDRRILDGLREVQAKSSKGEHGFCGIGIWRIIMQSKMTRIAVAAIIIVAVLIIFTSSESTLYAQVVKAAKKASTIHITGLSPRDGKLQKSNEIWYKRGTGIKITWKRNEKEHLILDDGDYRWKYNKGSTSAIQHKSSGIDDLPREITEPGRYLDKCTRDNTGDMEIDKVMCKLYTGSYPEKANSTKLMFWIDENNRFRRFEEKILEDGVWKTIELCHVEYDIDFDNSIFEPDFGSDVEIVKANGMLDSNFKLENAIFKTEEMGLIFAVHELKRCQNGLIFALTSLRPTEQTRADIKSTDPRAMNYGDYQFGSCFERNEVLGTSYNPRELAWIYHNGLKVKWTIFEPSGFGNKKVSQCKFELYYLYANGKLAAKRIAAGLPDRKRFKPIATLDVPDAYVNLENQISSVYDLVKSLEPVVAEKHLLLKSIPFTDEEMDEHCKKHSDGGIAKLWGKNKSSRLYHDQSKRPSQIDKDAWIADRLAEIDKYSMK